MAISTTGILYSIVYRLNKAAGRMIILYFIFCNLVKKFDIHRNTFFFLWGLRVLFIINTLQSGGNTKV